MRITDVRAHKKHAWPIAGEDQAKGFDNEYWKNAPMFVSPQQVATILLNHFVLWVHHYVGVVGFPASFECACGWKSKIYLMCEGDAKSKKEYLFDPNGPQVEYVKHVVSIL